MPGIPAGGLGSPGEMPTKPKEDVHEGGLEELLSRVGTIEVRLKDFQALVTKEIVGSVVFQNNISKPSAHAAHPGRSGC